MVVSSCKMNGGMTYSWKEGDIKNIREGSWKSTHQDLEIRRNNCKETLVSGNICPRIKMTRRSEKKLETEILHIK